MFSKLIKKSQGNKRSIMEHIQTRWITGRECIGVVLVKTDDKLKAYIRPVDGFDEQGDIKQVMDYGTKLDSTAGKGLFPQFAADEWH